MQPKLQSGGSPLFMINHRSSEYLLDDQDAIFLDRTCAYVRKYTHIQCTVEVIKTCPNLLYSTE